jgi:hypothetical protein
MSLRLGGAIFDVQRARITPFVRRHRIHIVWVNVFTYLLAISVATVLGLAFRTPWYGWVAWYVLFTLPAFVVARSFL